MRKLHLDFETRSVVDLKTAGLDNYARHETTRPWCMSWSFDDEEPKIWTPDDPRVPSDIRDHVSSFGLLYAHSADFEFTIWNRIMAKHFGWPEVKLEQMRCTRAMSYAMGLPGALEKAAAAVGIKMQKDMKGQRLMLQMAKPRAIIDGKIIWWDDPEKQKKLQEYCKQDVRVERELESRIFNLSDKEQRLWFIDQRINRRGIYIDAPTVKKAILGVKSEADRLNDEIRNATDNFVGFTTEVARIKKWLASRGVELPGVAKADILDGLSCTDIPDDCRKVLLLRQEAGKTSTAKLNTMISAASTHDGRVRETMQYHGAFTGRWAGRRIQPHNYPRPKIKHHEIETILNLISNQPTKEAIDIIEIMYGPYTHIISDCLRGMITAGPGNLLVAGDYGNIEGRGLAWLAGDERKLDAFRKQDKKRGPEIYKLAASKIYHKSPEDISSLERSVGKVSELALGYQGGVGAFQQMATGYNVEVSDEEAEIIKLEWRNAHPKIVQYWFDLQRAAFDAVSHPRQAFKAGPPGREVTYKVSGSFLFCKLPSDRVIVYPYPSIKPVKAPWGDWIDQVHYKSVDSKSYKFVETPTYGGKLSENVTQAVCRDILRDAIFRLEEEDFPVVFHVHDEIINELSIMDARMSSDRIFELMSKNPEWADGFPIVVEGWVGKRYRK